MFSSSSHDTNIQDLLKDPDSKLEDIISSNDFVNLWMLSDNNLFSFLIKHYGELIDIGFQVRTESTFSIRCLQIISSNPFFRHRLFTETNFLNFIYNYLFNISTFPEYSQKNYFYVLPNIMIDKFNRLESIFNKKFFMELFDDIHNDFAYNFILRLIKYGPSSLEPVLKQINLGEKIVLNIIDYHINKNSSPDSKLLLIRNQDIFKAIINSNFDVGAFSALNDHIEDMINNNIQYPNTIVYSFIHYIDEFSMNSFALSKWQKIHLKIIPHLSTFCDIVLKSKSGTFTSLSESCVLLAIGITSTTKNISQCFLSLFEYLNALFFELKTNNFLHNCFLKAFNLLLSLGKINSTYLDQLNLFTKIIECYENRDINRAASYYGHLYLISKEIKKMPKESKTVDSQKWDQVVAAKNKEIKKIIGNNYGGIVPPDMNAIRIKNIIAPSFFTTNLFITIMKSDKKNSSPLS